MVATLLQQNPLQKNAPHPLPATAKLTVLQCMARAAIPCTESTPSQASTWTKAEPSPFPHTQPNHCQNHKAVQGKRKEKRGTQSLGLHTTDSHTNYSHTNFTISIHDSPMKLPSLDPLSCHPCAHGQSLCYSCSVGGSFVWEMMWCDVMRWEDWI